jgi:hypothetical protein
VQIVGQEQADRHRRKIPDRGQNVGRESDGYMTGMLLTGIGKGFLSLDGGALTTGGDVGFSAGMTSEENLIFCFLRSTSVLT